MPDRFSRSIIRVGSEARVAELHAAIEDAEAALRAIQQEGSERAAERARFEWRVGEGPGVPDPDPGSVVAQLAAIRLPLARKGGSPRVTAEEADLARRGEILRSAITALSVRVPDHTSRLTDVETRLRQLRDALRSLATVIVDMVGTR